MRFFPDRLERRAFLVAAAFLLVLLVAAPSPAQQTPFPPLTLQGLDGGYVDLGDLRGRPVLLNFWATWCGPCRMELPVLQRVYDRYNGRGLVVLSINTDVRPDPVRPFLQQMRLSLPVYTTTPEDQSRAGVYSLPTTFLLDGEGRIVRRENGYSGRLEQDLNENIEKLLPSSGAKAPGKA